LVLEVVDDWSTGKGTINYINLAAAAAGEKWFFWKEKHFTESGDQ